MNLDKQKYRSEDDFWRIRTFLREVFLLNKRRELSWQAARLDYWRWHVIENCGVESTLDKVTFNWETDDSRIAAVLNTEGHGHAFLNVHPDFRTPTLEAEMIQTAEENLYRVERDTRKLILWAYDGDDIRQDILNQKGFEKIESPERKEHQWSRNLSRPFSEVSVADGYSIRSLGEESELPSRSWASWRAFHPDEPDVDYEGWDWYKSIQRIPMYRRDLDIVAISHNNEIAAFCTIWYDDVTRTGYYEPVGTVPEHQRKGLGKSVMMEGLQRLKSMGALIATVGGNSNAANALYRSVMSKKAVLYERWEKTY